MKNITSSRLINLPVIAIICCISALVLATTVSSEAPKNVSAGKAKEAIRMFDVGVGPRAFNFQLGRETKTQYFGNASIRQLVEAEQIEPRTMVSDDFNGDGMGDLVIGYANANGGVLGLRQGNLQAIAPSDPEVLEGVGQGRYPSPFLPEVTLYSLPEAPDFLQVGDFNSDGYSDVMAAARGGQRIYLLAGDGRGRLGDPTAFDVPGLVTAMQAGREQPGKFTSLALGLFVPGGAALSVYREGGDGLAAEPANYDMPSEVTSLTYGDLNQDGTPDVAAVAGSEVAVVYQIDVDGSPSLERASFPFNIRGVAAGNFVFDRGHQNELALLADDGTIHLADKGQPDRRAYSEEEIEFVRKQRVAWHKGEQDMDSLIRNTNSLVDPATRNNGKAAWNVTETLNTGAASPYTRGPGLIRTARMAGLALDDLLVGSVADNSVQIVKNQQDIAKLKVKTNESSGEAKSVTVESAPLAVVAMRLSINGLPGMVVLHAGQTEPTVSINSPNAVFVVNTTLDQIDLTQGNGVCNSTSGCSLRAAITESNFVGGSNSITLPNGTYTLTLGPFDDEFNTFGANMDSGDLDVIDLSFGGFPLLTAVTINGGGRDTAIIQMGTLAPAGAGGINKDRVIESNNFVIPQHGTSLTLNNLTVQSGNAPRTPAPDNYNTKGGGIQFDGFDSPSSTNLGVLTVTNCKFTSNTSAGQGGGIFALFGGLTVQTTSIVSANTSTFAAGGGIQHSGGNVITTTFNINNSTIGGALVTDANNAGDATFGSGGGVDSVGANAFNITNGAIVRNNTAGITTGNNGGGGVHIGNSKSIVFSNSTISDNKCKHNGGGIWVSARDAVTNAASTITLTTMNVTTNQADSDNTLVGDGGGLFTFFGAATVQTTSHVDGNSAVNGGGIFAGWTGIAADPTAGLTVNTNSTIGQAGAGNGNSAKNNGGSIAINPVGASSFGTITLDSLTFTNNTANSDSVGGGDGGAIFVGAGILTSLNNCTIDTNVANSGTGDGIRQTGGTINVAGTLNVNGGDSISISGGTFTSTSGTLNLTGDFMRDTAGTFNHNSGTLNFNGTGAQNINGTATSETFNNFTVNKGGGTLATGGSTTSITANNLTMTLGTFTAPATLTISGNTLLTAGTFNAGTTINAAGNWTNNSGAAAFVPGAGTVTFNSTTATQTINGTAASQTFNNVTVSKTGQVLNTGGSTTQLDLNGNFSLSAGTFTAPATVNVIGDWTQTSGTTFTPGSGTVNFSSTGTPALNGTAAMQTFNNLVINKTGNGSVTGGGSLATLNLNGAMTLTAGTFSANTITAINLPGNWTNNGGMFSPGSSNVTFNSTTAGQSINGSAASQQFFTLTMNKTGQTLSTGGSTTTLDINSNLVLTAGTFTAPATMTIAGNFTQATGTTFTPGAGTVTFDGNAAQSIDGTLATKTFFGFGVNKAGGTLSPAASTTALDINGAVTLTLGTFAAGTATAITVAGNWTNNGGTFTPGVATETVTFDGGAGQTISGTTATTFNRLTNSDAGGISMTNDNTVNGILALTSSDITVSATKTLTQPVGGSSSGTFDVNGRVQRTGFVTGGSALSFGNPLNTIQVTAGVAPANIVVDLARSVPTGAIGFPNAVQRTYTITPSAGGFTGTLRLHYLDSELNGNTEGATLILRRFNGTGWAPVAPTSFDTAANWAERTGVTTFSPWTLSSCCSPTATNGTVSGRITDADGAAVAGAAINLSGNQSRETITDAEGNYSFDSVEINGFYTVTPARVNYAFSPANRSFSLLGVHTEASFTATANGDHLNAIDTTEFFVRQQYLDFLGREPDPPGFIGWVNTLRNCAAGDPSCDRVHVSEAFFRSQEFQERGYFVYRFYSSAFGRKPDYSEFTPDLARVSGFLTKDQLEAAKTAFVNDFMARPSFATQYNALSNAAYVDALISTAAVNLSNRQSMIDGLNARTLTRAQALRQIAESGEVYRAYYNQAFVVMEYFGYLRRDPDALYTNWIQVLDANPADSRRMVEGFVDATEYRNRFTQ